VTDIEYQNYNEVLHEVLTQCRLHGLLMLF